MLPPQFRLGSTCMSIAPGTYTLGPDNAELLVRTGRTGAAAKAGHDLVIEVTSWSGRLEVGEHTQVELTADGASLSVREGKGGIQSLGEDDKRGIRETIDSEVLKQTAITFRSTSAQASDAAIEVQGELELLGRRAPVRFTLTGDENGVLTGSAGIRQTDWGIKPY